MPDQRVLTVPCLESTMLDVHHPVECMSKTSVCPVWCIYSEMKFSKTEKSPFVIVRSRCWFGNFRLSPWILLGIFRRYDLLIFLESTVFALGGVFEGGLGPFVCVRICVGLCEFLGESVVYVCVAASVCVWDEGGILPVHMFIRGLFPQFWTPNKHQTHIEVNINIDHPMQTEISGITKKR